MQRFIAPLTALFLTLPFPLLAEPMPHEFKDLRRLERRDFIETARRLYIVGNPEKFTGLFQRQSLAIERLHEVLGVNDDPALARKFAIQIFDLSQAARDLNRQFENLAGSERGDAFFESLYKQVIDSQKENPPQDFKNLIRRLDLEIDRKLFALSFPLLWAFDALPGIEAYNFDLYMSLQPHRQIPEDIKNKILSKKTLTESEYLSLRPEFAARPEAQKKNLYQLYLLISDLKTSALEEKALTERAKAAGLEPREAAGLARIYEGTVPPRLMIDWSFPKPADTDIRGLDFLIQELGPISSRLQSLQAAEPKDIEWLHQFQKETYEVFIEKLDGMTLGTMKTALEQLKSGEWANLGQDFVYFELERKNRLFFLAANFPELKLAQAEALMELRFVDLSADDRLDVLEVFCPDIEESLEFMQREHRLAEAAEAWVRDFHRDFVKAYWNRDQAPDPLPETYVMNDRTLSRLKPHQEQMKELIIENEASIDSGIFPKSLIEYLMVEFYSTPESLKETGPPLMNADIWARIKNEWDRQGVISKNLRELSALQASSATAEEILQKQIEFNEELQKYPLDPEADIAILGALAFGVVPKDRNDFVSIAKSIGTGVALLVAGRFIGWKNLFWLTFTDTGVRVVSAGFFSENEFDLRQGFSTPLGLWTAEGLSDLWSLYLRMTHPTSAEEQLSAFRDFGAFARDMIIFRETIGGANRLADWSRFSRIRKIRSLEMKAQRLRSEIQLNEFELKGLRSELVTLEARLLELQKMNLATSPESMSLGATRLKTLSRIAVLEGKAQGNFSKSKLGFYSVRIFEQLFRLGDFLVPIPGKTAAKVRQESFLTRFNRRRWIGIEQYRAEILRAEAKVAKIDGRQFVDDHRSATGAERKTFTESWKGFTRSQNQVARFVSEAEALRLAKDYSGTLSVLKKAAHEVSLGETFIENLTATAKAPKPLSRSSELLVYLDRWEAENLRPILNRTRPVEAPALSPGRSGDRFFRQADFNLRSQGSLLKEFFESLKGEIKSLPAESRAALSNDVRMLEIALQKY